MQSQQHSSRNASTRIRAQRDAVPQSASGPRLVTRGETDKEIETSANVAFLDWLAVTVKPPLSQGLAWIRQSLAITFCIPEDAWKSSGRGWNGYQHRIDLGPYGLLAFGGEAQRGTFHFELNAHACKLIADWNAVRVWGETYEASITRLDLAHDDFAGAQINIDKALESFREGQFSTNGRPPAAQFIDDLGSNKGKTLYIGQRTSGKLLRIYEKGKQLGDPGSTWLRAEVELHNKGRYIPWNAVTSPGKYLAGAYPALAFLSTEQDRLRTTQRAGQISYETMVRNLRTQGGKSLNVMCKVLEGDTAAVLSQVMREGMPKRLAGFTTAELEIAEAQT